MNILRTNPIPPMSIQVDYNKVLNKAFIYSLINQLWSMFISSNPRKPEKRYDF